MNRTFLDLGFVVLNSKKEQHPVDGFDFGDQKICLYCKLFYQFIHANFLEHQHWLELKDVRQSRYKTVEILTEVITDPVFFEQKCTFCEIYFTFLTDYLFHTFLRYFHFILHDIH